ncbi:META domain-containing protein [Cellulomonas wangsupingiae]|uniref:META domain-containing protein n=1 Tax=Cellulomonas wangsupingiae TaxID=2968085 RepID=A0ABY5K246_9CELL|nr:META domain-containing protein [Cellulomonas wangsupingiae]MCC2336256.1 META domain-containing protein [Cellulomonas wangsupingiae]UUI64501.1 META domain-containing protein [Cellulomonas wangsupingiae]
MARTTVRRRTRWRATTGTGRRSRRASVTGLALAGVLVAAGCATGTEPGDQETFTASSSSSPGASATSAAPTADGAWTLQSGDVDGTALTLVESAPVTLLLEEGRASGSAACNTYTTSVDTSDGWRIEPAGVTRMACAQDLMTLESTYLDALARVDAAEVTDGTLELTGPDVRLVFAADGEADAG